MLRNDPHERKHGGHIEYILKEAASVSGRAGYFFQEWDNEQMKKRNPVKVINSEG